MSYEKACRCSGYWSWCIHCNEHASSELPAVKWLTASRLAVEVIHVNWAGECHILQMLLPYLLPTGSLSGVLLPFPAPQVFKTSFMSNGRAHYPHLKNTLWSLPATFAVRLHAEISCLSHPSQPHSLAVGTTNDAKRKSSNYLQLSLSAYTASERVLTRLLYWSREKPDLKQHPSCWGCRGHLGDYIGSSALRIALYLGTILLCTGKVGERKVVHEWEWDRDNSTQLCFIIYLYHCQIWTSDLWYGTGGKCPQTPSRV